jgi:hypothetical protein
VKISARHRYAMVCVCTALATDGSPRVSITAAWDDGASRQREADEALAAAFVADELRDLRLPPDGLAEDLFANAAYRCTLVGVLAGRRVALAKDERPAWRCSDGLPLPAAN